jgi:BlaI family transcriptional regulator, penicillinase repressor
MARKSRNHRLDLPSLELECMKALWTLREATVHGIRSQFFSQRPLAYTTVMTVMDRLARKGIVEREKRGRAHVYRPLVSDAEVRDHALDRLLNNFFRGSRDRLRQHLEGRHLEEPERLGPGGRAAALASRDASSPRAAAGEAIDPSLL